MSLYLPDWPTDRLVRATGRDPDKPLATFVAEAAAAAGAGGRRQRIAAVNRAAARAGIRPGLPLADARALLPGLDIAAADPAGDAAALRRLARWCGRYSPWTAPDGADGVRLDITGCAHLQGGEAALASAVAARLHRFGFACRAAIADTPGAAWALARYGEDGGSDGAASAASIVVAPPGGMRAALAPLPPAALRLAPADAALLDRLGLRRIGDLYALPRADLARRVGADLMRQLDRALGAAGEPLSPLPECPARQARLAFAEPIADPSDLARAIRRLADALCRGALAAEAIGARRLALDFYRIDGHVPSIAIGTARPSRDPRHLARLLEERLETVDPGLGIEAMVLTAVQADPLAPTQRAFPEVRRQPPPTLQESPSRLAGEGRGGGTGKTLRSTSARLAVIPPTPSLPRKAGGGDGRAEPQTSPQISLVREPPGRLPAGMEDAGEEKTRPGLRLAWDADIPDLGNEEIFPWLPRLPRRKGGGAPPRNGGTDDAEIAELVDRIEARFGPWRVARLVPCESHVPERAQQAVPVAATGPAPSPPPIASGARWPAGLVRPVRLLAPPEPIDVTAPVPDDPPAQFVWRRRRHIVRRADGPERVAAEWWRDGGGGDDPMAAGSSAATAAAVRDYYRVEDEEGRRFWLFRAGLYGDAAVPGQRKRVRWYLHGLFP
jgi:protein ImuB